MVGDRDRVSDGEVSAAPCTRRRAWRGAQRQPAVDDRLPQRPLRDRLQLDEHGGVPVEVRDREEGLGLRRRAPPPSRRGPRPSPRGSGRRAASASPKRRMSALLNGRSHAKALPATNQVRCAVALALGDLGQVQRHPRRPRRRSPSLGTVLPTSRLSSGRRPAGRRDGTAIACASWRFTRHGRHDDPRQGVHRRRVRAPGAATSPTRRCPRSTPRWRSARWPTPG